VPASPPRESLKEELARALGADLAVRERAYRAACDAAKHEEAKPENDKDTRALEQSYLARGEGRRLEELRSELARLHAMPLGPPATNGPVSLGAMVSTEEDGEPALFWLAPCGGGTRLAGGAVQVLTPKSPLGQALLGGRAGDECEVQLAGKKRVLRIVTVA
jgi:transcription elongation GreA/GreB family factor